MGVPHPGPWRKGEHSFEKGQQVLDADGNEIAWIRYNDPADVDLMISAPYLAGLLREATLAARADFRREHPDSDVERELRGTHRPKR